MLSFDRRSFVELSSNAIQNNPRKRLHIHDLPEEVMLHLFDEGCDRKGLDPHPERNIKCRPHPFVVCVIKVCARWKTLCSADREGKIHVRDRFIFTRASFEIDHLDQYATILQFAEYRSTLLTSANTALFIHLLDNTTGYETDAHNVHLLLHAIDVAFQQRSRLRYLYVYLCHSQTIQFLAYHLQCSTHLTFGWHAIFYLDSWDYFCSPCADLFPPQVDPIKHNGRRLALSGHSSSLTGDAYNRIEGVSILDVNCYEDTLSYLKVLSHCIHITRLFIYHSSTFDSPIGAAVAPPICLPQVKTLEMYNLTRKSIADLFEVVQFPRLWFVKASAVPTYPFRGISLPDSLTVIEWENYVSDHDWLDEYLYLRDELEFAPTTEISLDEDMHRFSCTMVSKNNRSLRLSIFGHSFGYSVLELTRCLAMFLSTFQDTLRQAHGGQWLFQVILHILKLRKEFFDWKLRETTEEGEHFE